MISFIVSVYDRMDNLNACLASLHIQDFSEEILVCCNSHLNTDLAKCGYVCQQYNARMFKTGLDGAGGCYESAEMVAPEAKADWLCFPSDDSLYVADFSSIMLTYAVSADLVYCDCVYKQGSVKGGWPAYSVLDVSPRMGRIDKTCFILRRELFTGFPSHPQNYRDGALIEELVRKGVRHAKAPGVLCIHQ